MRVSPLLSLRRSPLSLALLLLCLLALAAVLWLSPRLTSTALLTHGNEPIVVRRSGLSSLIVYDGPAASGDGLITARYVANLLGHFGIRPDIRHISGYVGGLAEQFNATFVCGAASGTTMPKSLLADLARSEKPVCWINRHLGQFTSQPDAAARLGFAGGDFLDDEEFSTIIYLGMTLPKNDSEINGIKITDAARVQIVATARDANGEMPYVVRSGSFWYFADSVFGFNSESDRSIVFADLLHDILNQPHQHERRAMVRIEDVSADSDPRDLRRVADLLYSRRVPFQIALIPIFKDPARRIETYLSDEPGVVDALHYMVAHGGTIVLHGVTHQLHGASADDFEFWDSLSGRATPDGSLTALSHKLEAALDECFHVGLYPVAWETPHYTASLEHYRALATVFTHTYERRMVVDESGTEQYFPYEAEDWLGQSIIPENLGYINGEDPEPNLIVEAAGRLLAVRDPIASFFFHPYLDSQYLEIAIDGIARYGYDFVSAKQFGCGLSLGDYAVATAKRTLDSAPGHSFLRRVSMDGAGRTNEQTEKTERGKYITQQLDPPSGGLIAVQGVARPPMEPPRPSLLERASEWITGKDGTSLPQSHVRARRAVLLTPPSQSEEAVRGVASFKSLLDVYGVPVICVAVAGALDQADELSANLREDVLLVVPRQAAIRLPNKELEILANWIEGGGRALIEGKSELAERLGFRFTSRKQTISQEHDFLFPDSEIIWSHPGEVERFEAPPVTATLIEDADSQAPLAVASREGNGVVLYLAADLDPETGLGYARYPYLFHHLQRRFGLAPPLTAYGAEYYFDPGFREQAPIEKLVASWQRDGIRSIYAAAWHFYPQWNYDYDRLIRLCHERGIAVYAWFELPQVSQKFWDEHPEWREKTATGSDAGLGWRKMMNLANDACRREALDFVASVIESHDWDGVNIAELGFDSNGLEDPNAYVPMNDDVRVQFRREAGFDPRQLFNETSAYHWQANPGALARWSKFRSDLVRNWLVAALDRVSDIRTHRQLDVICTVLDSLHNPNVIEKTGTDTRDVIALMERYDFTLQIEDPADRWGNTPTRYREFGETYKKLVSDPSRLMFDINVVRDRARGIGPTDLMSGTELALAVASAARAGNGRVGIYSEASLRPEDRALVSMVLGSAARVNSLSPEQGETHWLATNRTVRYGLPSGEWSKEPNGRSDLAVVLDGVVWQCGSNGEVIVPAGEHSVGGGAREWNFTDQLGFGVVVKDITAEVEQVERTSLGVAINYSSPTRSWVTVARQPRAVQIDGRPAELALIRSGRDWLLEIPGGRHVVEIQDATVASIAVDLASVLSSRLIVWLGIRFFLLIGGLYIVVRMRRGFRHVNRILRGELEQQSPGRAGLQPAHSKSSAVGRSTGPLQPASSKARE